MASARFHTGCVEEFDTHVGLGCVRSGADRHPFHCTAIADGSRDIEVGADVRFELVPGRSGRWEATRIEPLLSR